MKGLVFDIKHYAIHDGPGIRTTVFFKGCPMACLWCHNPESQSPEPEFMLRKRKFNGKECQEKEVVGKEMSLEELMIEIRKDKVFYEESGGGVTFSGGEPLVQSTFLREVLSLCKSEGIHTALDTSGHANSVILQEVMKVTDLFLYDLKLMNDFDHQKYTGVSNRLSLANLDTLIDRGKEIIIRFPIISGITNDEKNIESIARFMSERNLQRIDLLPYHKMASNKYRQLGRVYELDHLKDNSAEELQGIADFFSEKGFVVSS
jgi:pyruvate formate lyase activating enzyme